jgi:hypothetical protein
VVVESSEFELKVLLGGSDLWRICGVGKNRPRPWIPRCRQNRGVEKNHVRGKWVKNRAVWEPLPLNSNERG